MSAEEYPKKYKVLKQIYLGDIALNNDNTIVIVNDDGEDYTLYIIDHYGKIRNEGKKYKFTKASIDNLTLMGYFEEIEENEENNSQEGGKRRKHRKTRHRKMKRSKTLKRKVRR